MKSKLIKRNQKGSVLQQNPIDYVHQKFPVTKNIEFHPYLDNNFRPGIGYGDIEYMNAEHNYLPYFNYYSKPDSLFYKPSIVYNSNIAKKDINEAIALDAVTHGLREQDLVWRKIILPKLTNAFLDDIAYGYECEGTKLGYDINVKFDQNLYYEQIDSAIDGIIRNFVVDDQKRKALKYQDKEELMNDYNKEYTPEQKKAIKLALNYLFQIKPPKLEWYQKK